MTDEERIKIALARFTPRDPGALFWSGKRLKKEFDRDEATISRAWRAAFRRGLVQVARSEQPVESAPLDEALAQRLKERFVGLNAIVLGHRHEENPESDPRARSLDGDRVHRSLGSAAAAEVSRHGLLRAGDVVGLGSGRGVYYTIRELEKATKLAQKGIKLVSLTGAVYAQDHSNPGNVYMDADMHANSMGLCFSEAVEPFHVSRPIACSSEKIRDSELSYTHLSDEEWSSRVPNVAIVGVGVVSAGHTFYRQVSENAPKRMLEPVANDLGELVEICRQINQSGTRAYPKVADCCNHMFLVEPAEHESAIDDRRREKLVGLIKRINARLLTVSREKLSQIGSVLLVAGTREKAAPVLELIEPSSGANGPLQSVTLCTDRALADELLQLGGG